MAEKRFEFLSKVFARVEKWQNKAVVEVDRIPKITEELEKLEKEYLKKKGEISLLSKQRKWKEILDLDIDFGGLESSISAKRDIIAEIRKNHRLTEDLGRKVSALQVFVDITYLKRYPDDVKQELLNDLMADLTQEDIEEEIRKINILESMSKSKELAPDSSGEMIITYEAEEYPTGVEVKIVNIGNETLRIEAIKGTILEALIKSTTPLSSAQLIEYLNSHNVQLSGAFSYRIRNLNKIISKYGYRIVNVGSSGKSNAQYSLLTDSRFESNVPDTRNVSTSPQEEPAVDISELTVSIDGKVKGYNAAGKVIVQMLVERQTGVTLDEMVRVLATIYPQDSDEKIAQRIFSIVSSLRVNLKMEIERNTDKQTNSSTYILAESARQRIEIINPHTLGNDSDILFASSIAQDVQRGTETPELKNLNLKESAVLEFIQASGSLGATRLDLLELLHPGVDHSILDHRKDQDVYRIINALRSKGINIKNVGGAPARYVLEEYIDQAYSDRGLDTAEALQNLLEPQEVEYKPEPEKFIWKDGKNLNERLTDKEYTLLFLLKSYDSANIPFKTVAFTLNLDTSYRSMSLVLKLIKSINDKLKINITYDENSEGYVQFIQLPLAHARKIYLSHDGTPPEKSNKREVAQAVEEETIPEWFSNDKVWLGFYYLIVNKIINKNLTFEDPNMDFIVEKIYDLAEKILIANGVDYESDDVSLEKICNFGVDLRDYEAKGGKRSKLREEDRAIYWYMKEFKNVFLRMLENQQQIPENLVDELINEFKTIEPQIQNALLNFLFSEITGKAFLVGARGTIYNIDERLPREIEFIQDVNFRPHVIPNENKTLF